MWLAHDFCLDDTLFKDDLHKQLKTNALFIYLFFFSSLSLSRAYRSSSLSSPAALLVSHYSVAPLPKSNIQVISKSKIKSSAVPKQSIITFSVLQIRYKSITWEWLLLTPPNDKHWQSRTKKCLRGCTITKASHIRKVNKQ